MSDEVEELGGSDDSERASRDHEASVRQLSASQSQPTITRNITVDQYRNEVKLRNCSNLEKQITKRLGIGNKAENVAFKEVGERKFLKLDKNVLLGSGSNGTRVYLGTFRQSVTNDEKLVAIKRIQYDTEAEYKATYREVATLQKLNHSNVIKYLFADNNDEFNLMFIALELCRGSLINIFELRKDVFECPFILKNRAPANDWWFKKHLLLGIANGLDYIHQQGHVHRDLKPQNILVQGDDSNIFGYKAVICDFELAKEMEAGKSKLSVSQGIVGTQGWMAKEVLAGGAQTKALDVFAYGCIVQFVLVENRDKHAIHPFGADIHRDNAIMESKRSSYISTHIADINGSIRTTGQSYYVGELLQGRSGLGYEYLGDAIIADLLVSVCISGDKTVRPSAPELLLHPFFWSYEKRIQSNEMMFNLYKHDFQRHDIVSLMEKNWRILNTYNYSSLIPDAWEYYVSHRKATKGKLPSSRLSSSLFNCLMRLIRNLQQHYEEAIALSPELEVALDGNSESLGKYFFEGVPLAFPVIYIYLFQYQCNSPEKNIEVRRKIYQQQLSTLMNLKSNHRAL
ncbi:serine/threonine-protein kinase/endoribonuclease IRE2-like [Bolinopsis microptera]|uniref:serine/threonine-protein kinase/endoribonuclease IRE2-like n=1 Tax=Bolinopsis microptera TaxID=2820187 RepID=UPI00307978F6